MGKQETLGFTRWLVVIIVCVLFQAACASQPNVKFTVEELPSGKTNTVFIDAPAYIHSLEMAPSKRENKLNRGIWLVLVCAKWSSPDLAEIDDATRIAVAYKGNVQLGVRLFNEYSESKTWLPGILFPSPAWLVLRDGEVVGKKLGLLSEEELKAFINESLNESNAIEVNLPSRQDAFGQ